MSKNQDEKDEATVPDVSSTEFVSPPESGETDPQTSPISPGVVLVDLCMKLGNQAARADEVAVSQRAGSKEESYWSGVATGIRRTEKILGEQAAKHAVVKEL